MAIRTGILWMLVATCLFVCQDSTARILLKTYPAAEIAFARFFVHMVLVSIFIAWRDPRLMISRRPLLQMLRSSFLLGATLFGMLALKIMPFVDFSAIVWVTPVLTARCRSTGHYIPQGSPVAIGEELGGVWARKRRKRLSGNLVLDDEDSSRHRRGDRRKWRDWRRTRHAVASAKRS
ncbi:MAG: hypothetical protein ACREDD_06240 [Methylocella sp.]